MRGVVIPHYARPALANLYLEEHVDVPDPVLFIQQYTELMGFQWDLNDAGFATDLSEHHGDKPAVWFQVGIDSGYPIAQMLQLLAAYQDFSGVGGGNGAGAASILVHRSRFGSDSCLGSVLCPGCRHFHVFV